MDKENLGKTAFVFPGQGSQRVGMGNEIFKNHAVGARIFQEASDVLQYDMAKLCFEDPNNQLNETEFTQSAILTVSIAALRVIEEEGRRAVIVAGHSLGEYSAAVAADALDFPNALSLVCERAKFMREAGKLEPGRMAAVIGYDEMTLSSIGKLFGVEVANFNTDRQIVISGRSLSIHEASRVLRTRAGTTVIQLEVSIAAHSSLMEPARSQMESLLKSTVFKDTQIPVVVNVNSHFVTKAPELRRALSEQMTHPVLWVNGVRRMIKEGVDTFVEVGPGRVLSGLIKNIDRNVNIEATNS